MAPLVFLKGDVFFKGDDLDTFLNGRFEVRRLLGRGAMGVVYEAFDREYEQTVALKTLRDCSPQGIKRIKEEFRPIADVLHPNLVTLHELFADGERWFFTMELVRGLSFCSYVRGVDEKADLTKLRDGLVQLSFGLDTLHQAGYAHRDIKPSNVLVERSGRVVVLDFGLISELAGNAGRSRIAGTPAYMAPELLNGGRATPAADWYAVGVMLFEALTGQLPHASEKGDMLVNKTRLEAPVLSRLMGGIPDDLDTLCNGLLQLLPGERMQRERIYNCLGAQPPQTARLSSVRLVGRVQPMQMVRREFERVSQDGRVGTVFISGEAGVGKSAVLRRLCRDFSTDALVLTSRCFEREYVPYQALDSAMDDLAAHLGVVGDRTAKLVSQAAALFPSLGVARWTFDLVDRAATRREAFSALRDLMIEVSRERPIIIAIDDAQWGDADSAQLIAHLLAPPAPPRVLLVVCHGGGEPSSFINYLMERLPAAVEVPLPSLAVEELEELLLEAPANLSREAMDAAIAAANGNPRHALDLAIHMAERHQLVSIEEVYVQRIEALSEDARNVLRILSIAGHPISLKTAAVAVGLKLASGCARELAAHRLARMRGLRVLDDIVVEHETVVQAALQPLDDDARAELHRVLASAIQTGDGRADHQAIHFAAAGESITAATIAVAAAAEAHAALAFDREAAMLRLILKAVEQQSDASCKPVPAAVSRAAVSPSAEDGAASHAVAMKALAKALVSIDVDIAEIDNSIMKLRRRLVAAVANSGRSAAAADLWQRIAKDEEGMPQIEALRHAMELYFASGQFNRANNTLRQLLTQLDIPYPSSGRLAGIRLGAELLSAAVTLPLPEQLRRKPREATEKERLQLRVLFSAGLGMSPSDPIRSGYFMCRATKLAKSLDVPSGYSRGLAYVGMAFAFEGNWLARRGMQLIDEAEAIACREEDPETLAWVVGNRGVARTGGGLWRSAIEELERADRLFKQVGPSFSFERNIVRTTKLLALRQSGDLARMQVEAQRLQHEADALGDVFTAVEARNFASLGCLAADDLTDAVRLLHAARDAWNVDEFKFQDWTALHHALIIELYRGVGPEALTRLKNGVEAARAGGLMDTTQIVRAEAAFLRGTMCLQLANDSIVGRMYVQEAGEAVKAMRKDRRPWTTVLEGLLEAGLATRRNQSDEARAALQKARRQAEECSMALHVAVISWLLAVNHDFGSREDAERALAGLGVRCAPKFVRTLALVNGSPEQLMATG